MTDGQNLWVTPQAATPVQPQQPVQPSTPAQHQPAVQRQIGAVPAPAAPLGSFAWQPQGSAYRWWALGAHGGAGVSTLLRILTGGLDAYRRWPDVQGAVRGVNVVVVARTDQRGLEAATTAVQEWTGGYAPATTTLVGVVLMADAPSRPPKAVRDRIRVLSGAVPHVWEVPWIESFREGIPPQKPVRQLVELETVLRALEPPAVMHALPPAAPTPPPGYSVYVQPGAAPSYPSWPQQPQHRSPEGTR